MKTASKLLTALFFIFIVASTTGCSILEKYTSLESSTATELKQSETKAGNKATKKSGKKPGKKKTDKKAEEEDEITVYDVGGYAIKATLVYALSIALSR